ncbi:MAG: hypothetical protein BV459_04320 [Thermoplasmata archaeon M11B2D]|nr:MAG: hypothetical protein BV459_04320 [Thermoplasmata archaeon M11B2D]PNX53832.1 MAG: hypothetical protein BV458_02280 [Thermoplasmata archaeon M9B2D]
MDTADVTKKFITTIIEIIGRKTSQEYAAITIRNLLKKLKRVYPFLQYIEIKDARSLELEDTVAVNESINSIHPKKVGKALTEIIQILINSLGKTAGYFFIRETREKIGIKYDTILEKKMDIDLTLMQATYLVEKQILTLHDIQNDDVMRRFLKTLIEVIERQTSKTFAIRFIAHRVDLLREYYPCFNYITITDVRHTLGSEDVMVQQDINNIDEQDVGKAIKAILKETEQTLVDLGRNSIAGALKLQLSIEYLAKLREMGVSITPYNVSYNAVFIEVIKTLIEVIGKTRTENDAILMVNEFLRNMENKYEFLKQVKVSQAANKDELYHIMTSSDIDRISEGDARHAIQDLLESIIESLEKDLREEFIQQFKKSLDKKYLSRIEGLGVNLHLIELHHALLD